MYVYVATSWRNPIQPLVIDTLRAAGIDCYDFRNPGSDAAGFSWRDVGGPKLGGKGDDLCSQRRYLRMIEHPVAIDGFERDLAAMQRADAVVLVLPCGRSAHLELGWATGIGKPTAVLLDDPVEPELMYRLVDHLAVDLEDLMRWLTRVPADA